MEKFINFESVEVSGATKEEALAYAPFGIQCDATQAYRNARKNHTGAWTAADEKQFMLNYLEKKTKNLPGVGCYYTIEAAVVSTRERPYKIEDVKKEGACVKKSTFLLLDEETNQILAETPVKRVKKMVKQVDEDGNAVLDAEGKAVMVPALDENGDNIMVWKSSTKAEAKDLGRSLYDEGFTGNIVAVPSSKVVEGTDTAFRMTYAPSKGTKNGRYCVFGVKA